MKDEQMLPIQESCDFISFLISFLVVTSTFVFTIIEVSMTSQVGEKGNHAACKNMYKNTISVFQ